jgi:hypothetical protein
MRFLDVNNKYLSEQENSTARTEKQRQGNAGVYVSVSDFGVSSKNF